eukprot:1183761-Rhodomonas_salina.1
MALGHVTATPVLGTSKTGLCATVRSRAWLPCEVTSRHHDDDRLIGPHTHTASTVVMLSMVTSH